MSSPVSSPEREKRGRGRGSGKRSKSRSESPEKRARSPGDPKSDAESGNERRGRSRDRRGKRATSAGGEGGSLSKDRSDRSRSGRSRSGRSRSGRSRSGSSRKSGKSSRSPPKFGEKAFEKKSAGLDVRKRQSAIAKIRGLKSDPSEWTRQELADRVKKFARFVQDSKTGAAELVIEGKRLTAEDMTVLHESLKRFTEIFLVKINNCYITDEAFVNICASLRNLRHLKSLSIEGNLLTSASSILIIKAFSRAARKLQVLEIRGNSFLYQDGVDIFNAFPYLNSLNGINLEFYCNKNFKQDTLDVSKLHFKMPEIGVVCALVATLHTIVEIKLNNNQINSKGLIQLIESLASRPLVQRLDLSHNPITNDSTDFKGVEKLVELLRRSKQFTHIKLDGIPNIPPYLLSAITQSLQVNRSIDSLKDGYHFSKFITSVVEKKTAIQDAKKPSTETGLITLAEWSPKLDSVDYNFVRRNQLPGVTVAVNGDDISVSRVPYPRFNQYTF